MYSKSPAESWVKRLIVYILFAPLVISLICLYNQEMDVTSTAVAEILDELRIVYNHPARFYHDIEHINDMHEKLNESKHLAVYPDRIILVIWFHDAVYDPTRQDNELKSAELWSHKMQGHINEDAIIWGKRAILATIDHLPNTDKDIQLLLDLDLAPLGASWEQFQFNTKQIRQEYIHVPDYLFQEGRRHFFRKFLARKRIYGTDYWHDRLGAKARENMERELNA